MARLPFDLEHRALDAVTGVWRSLPSAVRRRVVHGLNDTFPVGVVGLIADADDRVLLLEHRFRFPYPWGLPGGFIEHGETFEDALRRELREELGLEVTVAPEPFDTELNVKGRYLSITLLARAEPRALTVASEARSEPKASGDRRPDSRRQDVASRRGQDVREAGLRPTLGQFSGEITGGGFFGPGELPRDTYPHQAAVVERFWAERRRR